MAAFPSEDRLRQKRAKSEQAIALAMKNRWDQAAQVNREILDMFPNEVDAYNRLGKALTELGRYADARDAYAHAVKLDPLNGIAAKNLQRLGKFAAEGSTVPSPSPVDPRLFIEESGKTTVTLLSDVRRTEATAKLKAGDQLQIERRGNQLVVADLTRSGGRAHRAEARAGPDSVDGSRQQVRRLRNRRRRPGGARDHSRDASLGRHARPSVVPSVGRG